MNHSFEIITSLQYSLKAATAQVVAFQSGKKYLDMQKAHEEEIRKLSMRIQHLEKELEKAHRETVAVRNQWFEVFEDLEKEHAKELAQAVKKAQRLEKRALHAEGKLEKAEEKITLQRRQIYTLETELEEEKGKNLQLRAQLNRDYENSSLPRGADAKGFPTAVRKPEGDPEASRGIRGTSPKSRKRTQPL